jgi:hypothetical protein
MGLFASLADPCIWMRRVDDHYKYIAVFVDDLAIASKDPAGIIRALTEDYKFKLKGTGPIEFHLGCNFFCDKEGVLCFTPHKYIEKLVASYERMLGYLGIPVKESFMFGDNESVINSSNIPAGKLHTRHIALSWHRVRESIATKILHFIHIPGAINPSDMLSKHWGYQQTWTHLQALLFW